MVVHRKDADRGVRPTTISKADLFFHGQNEPYLTQLKLSAN